ncbi:hypothetical protein QUB68_25045 [Microcoleus sp. A006_D1]|uniref:hypothetical protein n=1 Tax=Microcoleus sp. A006_D1 TaxID=3055267 RepID=UPI002FD0C148
MKLSLYQKFKALEALVQEISQSPDFLEYCEQKSDLTPEDSIAEHDMFSIESSVNFFLNEENEKIEFPDGSYLRKINESDGYDIDYKGYFMFFDVHEQHNRGFDIYESVEQFVEMEAYEFRGDSV